jgi:pimeloyl-ACP methyl ester carboxylesterase
VTTSFSLTAEELETALAATRIYTLADGRHLSYLDLGNPAGRPLFFFHGNPGSRVEGIAFDEAAKEYGYRVIAPDRPGQGGSTYYKKRRLLDWPEDVRQMADGLGIDHFAAVGVSGGGPPLIACAYAIPERLTAAVDLAGAAPLYTDKEARRELSRLDRLFATLGSRLPSSLFQLPFVYLGWSFRRAKTGADLNKVLGNSISEADRRLTVESDVARFLIRDIQVALAQGARGPSDDAILIYRDWGFAMADVKMPVHIFHGTEDKLVPYAFSEYMRDHLPEATLTPLEDQGHFTHLVHTETLFQFLNTM